MSIHLKPDIKVKNSRTYFSTTKDFVMLFVGLVSVVYLLNFTLGFVEFIPDVLPFVGNIDEVLATGILISVLNYFGLPLTHFFKRN